MNPRGSVNFKDSKCVLCKKEPFKEMKKCSIGSRIAISLNIKRCTCIKNKLSRITALIPLVRVRVLTSPYNAKTLAQSLVLL